MSPENQADILVNTFLWYPFFSLTIVTLEFDIPDMVTYIAGPSTMTPSWCLRSLCVSAVETDYTHGEQHRHLINKSDDHKVRHADVVLDCPLQVSCISYCTDEILMKSSRPPVSINSKRPFEDMFKGVSESEFWQYVPHRDGFLRPSETNTVGSLSYHWSHCSELDHHHYYSNNHHYHHHRFSYGT